MRSSEIKYVESKVSQSRSVEWPLASTQDLAILHVGPIACETVGLLCSKDFYTKICIVIVVMKKTTRF